MSSNLISVIPPELWKLPSLTRLHLANNLIEELTIPNSFVVLEYLDLTNNKIKVLPEEICQLKRLRTLLLKGNKEISNLPKGILCHLVTSSDFYLLQTLQVLEVDCLNFQFPPESIVQRGLQDIMNFLANMAEGYVETKRIKLITLGYTGAGKV